MNRIPPVASNAADLSLSLWLRTSTAPCSTGSRGGDSVVTT